MAKSKKAYILYNYNKYNNDYIYIKEYYDIKDIQKDFKSIKNTRSLYHYISESLDSVKQLLKDNYIIIKEDIS